VGGKTGSGDNRFKTFARGGGVISARPVSRTAAFVFYLGDRHFGVITASVNGETAGRFHFTSSLPVALLRLLSSSLVNRLELVSPRPPQTVAGDNGSPSEANAPPSRQSPRPMT